MQLQMPEEHLRIFHEMEGTNSVHQLQSLLSAVVLNIADGSVSRSYPNSIQVSTVGHAYTPAMDLGTIWWKSSNSSDSGRVWAGRQVGRSGDSRNALGFAVW
jgi:hypothetical protein